MTRGEGREARGLHDYFPILEVKEAKFCALRLCSAQPTWPWLNRIHRTLKGFRDYPPELMIPRERLLEKARRVYRSYGFAPIDTPALEYAEILLGKGGEESDKQLYRFKDHGDRDVALRFDLTVPFARFAAQHIGKLGTPFKRYHMGPVWRGENTAARPLPRVLAVRLRHHRHHVERRRHRDRAGHPRPDAWRSASTRFTIRVNNRLVLNGLLEELGLAEQDGGRAACARQAGQDRPGRGRGRDGREGRRHRRAGRARCWLWPRSTGTQRRDPRPPRARLRRQRQGRRGHSPAARTARRRRGRPAFPTSGSQLDLSIARGLDYYTGTIYETFLADLPGIGSVCSGGRYDNLAGLYTKQELPGVGASLGLDRLLAAMEELKLLPNGRDAGAGVDRAVRRRASSATTSKHGPRTCAPPASASRSFPRRRRSASIEYAEQRGFRLALIAGPERSARAYGRSRTWRTARNHRARRLN